MAKAKVKKAAKKKKVSAVKKAAPKAKPKAAPKIAATKAKKPVTSKSPKSKGADKKEIKPQTASSKKQAPQKEATAPKKPILGPIEPGRLGQKRNCLECGTKFYDFERLPITCPKCFSEFEASDFEPKINLKSDSKKARAIEKEEEPEKELVVSDSGEDFESLEDLSDDDSAVVGIGPDKDSDESFD
ncbi:MAG: FYDLN acid domain-containing protein [Pseudomonadota bacterium]